MGCADLKKHLPTEFVTNVSILKCSARVSAMAGQVGQHHPQGYHEEASPLLLPHLVINQRKNKQELEKNAENLLV